MFSLTNHLTCRVKIKPNSSINNPNNCILWSSARWTFLCASESPFPSRYLLCVVSITTSPMVTNTSASPKISFLCIRNTYIRLIPCCVFFFLFLFNLHEFVSAGLKIPLWYQNTILAWEYKFDDDEMYLDHSISHNTLKDVKNVSYK